MIYYKHRANNPLDPYKYQAVEIDVKSDGKKLVLGHDYNEITCSLAEYLDNCNPNTEIAVNIKQSGLCDALFDALNAYSLKSYFCFDMSFPDFLIYNEKYPEHTAIRLSEFEEKQFLKFKSRWVWVDIFSNHSFFDQTIDIPDKNIVVVDPRLHNSSYIYTSLVEKAYGLCL